MAAAALRQIWIPRFLPVPWFLCGPRRYASSSFKAADLQLEMTQEPHKKPDPSQPLLFGKTFTDHMLMVEWSQEKGWGQPRIQPFQNLTLHPACSALHYSLQNFDGFPSHLLWTFDSNGSVLCRGDPAWGTDTKNRWSRRVYRVPPAPRKVAFGDHHLFGSPFSPA